MKNIDIIKAFLVMPFLAKLAVLLPYLIIVYKAYTLRKDSNKLILLCINLGVIVAVNFIILDFYENKIKNTGFVWILFCTPFSVIYALVVAIVLKSTQPNQE